jgi:hypothetical protein
MHTFKNLFSMDLNIFIFGFLTYVIEMNQLK